MAPAKRRCQLRRASYNWRSQRPKRETCPFFDHSPGVSDRNGGAANWSTIMATDSVPLKAIHHVELLVGNARQAAYFYRHAFGFSQLAYAGPETGVKEQASYVLYQGNI